MPLAGRNNLNIVLMNISFKPAIYLETYFFDITNKHLRDLMVRFRIGASEIKLHKFRFSSDRSQTLQCPLCNCRLEDEMHFLFHCKNLQFLRAKYLPEKYCKFPTYDTLQQMFNDRGCVHSLARYIYYGLKLRRERTECDMKSV